MESPPAFEREPLEVDTALPAFSGAGVEEEAPDPLALHGVERWGCRYGVVLTTGPAAITLWFEESVGKLVGALREDELADVEAAARATRSQTLDDCPDECFKFIIRPLATPA